MKRKAVRKTARKTASKTTARKRVASKRTQKGCGRASCRGCSLCKL